MNRIRIFPELCISAKLKSILELILWVGMDLFFHECLLLTEIGSQVVASSDNSQHPEARETRSRVLQQPPHLAIVLQFQAS